MLLNEIEDDTMKHIVAGKIWTQRKNNEKHLEHLTMLSYQEIATVEKGST